MLKNQSVFSYPWVAKIFWIRPCRFSRETTKKHGIFQETHTPMKKNSELLQSIFFVFLVMIMSWDTGCASSKESPGKTQTEAWNIIIRQKIIGEDIKNKIVYVSIKPLKPGQKIKTWKETYIIPQNFQKTWVFFIDDQPNANWEHKCRYIFFDAVNGKYRVIKAHTPPISMDNMKKISP